VNVVMNLQIPQNAGSFLSDSETIGFSRGTQVHVVSFKFDETERTARQGHDSSGTESGIEAR
jgi:hypothetical protein